MKNLISALTLLTASFTADAHGFTGPVTINGNGYIMISADSILCAHPENSRAISLTASQQLENGSYGVRGRISALLTQLECSLLDSNTISMLIDADGDDVVRIMDENGNRAWFALK
jgi:hypothetical protein